MYQQLSVLANLTEGFVHRIGPEQLFKDLPAKHEHVVLLCLDTAQQAMYKAYLEVWPETQDKSQKEAALLVCCDSLLCRADCWSRVRSSCAGSQELKDIPRLETSESSPYAVLGSDLQCETAFSMQS